MDYCTAFDKFAWIYHPLTKASGKPKLYFEAIKSAAGENSKGVILDVGGGTGIIADLFSEEAQEIHVLDPSTKMLSKITNSKIQTAVGTAQKIPHDVSSFDLVYCVDSFHHFTNGYPKTAYDKTIEQCTKELLRVLKPGGSLIILDFNLHTFGGRVIAFAENYLLRFGSHFLYPEEMEELFKPHSENVTSEELDGNCYLCSVIK